MTVQAPGLTRPAAIQTAARMREGGWTYQQIADYLTGRGVPVVETTVLNWLKPPEDQERLRAANRRRARNRKRLMHPGSQWRVIEPADKLDRLRALIDAGLSPAAVAKVLRLDFGDVLTRHQVCYALKHGRYPRSRS